MLRLRYQRKSRGVHLAVFVAATTLEQFSQDRMREVVKGGKGTVWKHYWGKCIERVFLM